VHSLEKIQKAASKMVRFHPKVKAAEGPPFRPVPGDFARLGADKF